MCGSSQFVYGDKKIGLTLSYYGCHLNVDGVKFKQGDATMAIEDKLAEFSKDQLIRMLLLIVENGHDD